MSEEPIVYERVLEVTSSNEWIHPVSGARVQLGATEIGRLLELAEVVQRYKVESVADWSYAAEWGFLDEGGDNSDPVFVPTEEAGDRNEDGPFRSECNQVSVSGTGEFAYVCWQAYWKHTDVKVSTNHVNVLELREALERAHGPLPASLSGARSGLSCSSA